MDQATDGDAGEVLSERLVHLMKETEMPNGLTGVGYTEADVDALTEGAFPQRRLLDNAPVDISKDELEGIYRDALKYW